MVFLSSSPLHFIIFIEEIKLMYIEKAFIFHSNFFVMCVCVCIKDKKTKCMKKNKNLIAFSYYYSAKKHNRNKMTLYVENKKNLIEPNRIIN
jgi:hypothetical protein